MRRVPKAVHAFPRSSDEIEDAPMQHIYQSWPYKSLPELSQGIGIFTNERGTI